MNARRKWTIAGGALLAALAVTFGWPWVALAVHAYSYPVTGAGETANVVIDGAIAFASRANGGFEVIDTVSGQKLGRIDRRNRGSSPHL
jgi:hypothetical protein